MCSQHADYNVLINDLGDFLTYKGKLYIPWNLTKIILQEYYNTHSHFGQTHIQEMILEQFYWPQMTHDI